MKLRAETVIAADSRTVWRFSQTPHLHARWDARFSEIEYLPRPSDDLPQRFRYSTRIGFGFTVQGWGETVGRADRKTSALRFGSDDRKSLIREGSGSWRYSPGKGGVRFSTVYEYTVRYGGFGQVIDLVFRRLMIWATRWSFDRLRIWIEDGTPPETSLRLWIAKIAARCALGFVFIYEGLVPKIVAQSKGEIALVGQSMLYVGSPAATLGVLGACEIFLGLWLLVGLAEKLSTGLAAAAIVFLATLVSSLRTEMLADPLGGISKNAGLVACALVVWLLSDSAPSAGRASPDRQRDKRRVIK